MRMQLTMNPLAKSIVLLSLLGSASGCGTLRQVIDVGNHPYWGAGPVDDVGWIAGIVRGERPGWDDAASSCFGVGMIVACVVDIPLSIVGDTVYWLGAGPYRLGRTWGWWGAEKPAERPVESPGP